MALKTMIENLNKARRDYDDQLASFGSQAKEAVAAHLAAHIPEGFAVQWRQYTPYFNDGEPCTFRVRDAYLVKSAHAEEMDVYEEDFETCLQLWGADRYGESDREVTEQRPDGTSYRYTDFGIPLVEGVSVEQFRALTLAWSELHPDILKRAFGDHVVCRVTHDGRALTSDCNHD
ncbi:MAG: hypothetical protein ACTHU0_33600 [Kofleriaceae bacterium]